jgi:transposase InsO family protein
MILGLLDEATAAGASQAAACAEVGVDARTVQRWRAKPGGDDQRRGPKTRPGNKLTDAEEAELVALLTAPEFVGLSPHQLVAKLADMGIYMASEATLYRLLRRRKLLRHRDRARPRTHRRPREHVATGRNQVWAWDITYLPAAVRGTFWYLYAILDVWSRKVVAWEVHSVQSDELAAQIVDDACRREGVPRDQLVLHADNGAAMKGKTMLVKLQELGVVASFSRPRVSDDNPYAEALFRTLKYRPGYPDRPFTTVDDARRWVAGFVAWYNDDHQHSGIKFVTPSQRHAGVDVDILAHRDQLYRAARARRPERWSGETRDWNPVTTVRLNPEHGLADHTTP